MKSQEIRNIMLRKFYNDGQEKPGVKSSFHEFIPMGITEEEINFNAKYLHDKELLDVVFPLIELMPLSAQITAHGIDVVDPESTRKQYSVVQNNFQIIKGDISHSLVAQSAKEQTINISESFNGIYNQIDESENIDSPTKNELKTEIKEIEDHLTGKKIDLNWIKEKLVRIKDKGHWFSPILQNLIMEAIKERLGLSL